MTIKHIMELFALDGRDFVIGSYDVLLHREPDAHGLLYYLGCLNRGYGKAYIIVQIARSEEFDSSNKINGLERLIRDEAKKHSIFFHIFNRKLNINRLIEKNLVHLDNVSKSINDSAVQLINALKDFEINHGNSVSRNNVIDEKRNFLQDDNYHTNIKSYKEDFYFLSKRFDRLLSEYKYNGIMFVDITTLLKWNRPPVGIVRTIFEFVKYSLTRKDKSIEYFTFNASRDALKIVKRSLVEIMIQVLENDNVDEIFRKNVLDLAKREVDFREDGEIDQAYLVPYSQNGFSVLFDASKIIAKSMHCPFRRIDNIISIGLDWDSSNYDLLLELKKIIGFKFIGAYYDGIPIIKPEFLPNDIFCNMFFDYFCKLSELSDRVFTISKKSKAEYLSLMENEMIPGTKDIKYIRLGDPELNKIEYHNKEERKINGKFVVYVSTIEKRKNHILLLHIWKKLYHKYGERTPQLICIGMWGWGVDDVKSEYFADSNLQKCVKFLDDVGNNELTWFYENASFAVFPSHDEGWGLGASEAMTYSLPCITSSTPALLEATQNLMPFCEANNKDQWFDLIDEMISNPDKIESLGLLIKEKYVSKKWQEFSCELFEYATYKGE
ncbi:glycosyltransferase [Acidithiobacillus thiooxidans]|uniref:glycosyltransferase n=1 Tax=Acidithiobacillus thiooxidans TaxID=930 RepID=UPI00286477B2|nr:glycosyltransferase [Acidithiobacillus thiooxidans]MDR7927328.1 glycosyltransferase [Acidithiobacillus thiooxidans]